MVKFISSEEVVDFNVLICSQFIEEEDGVFDYKLKVLNALNKVKVNDQRVKEGAEVYLDFGDIIMLGNSKFKFDNH